MLEFVAQTVAELVVGAGLLVALFGSAFATVLLLYLLYTVCDRTLALVTATAFVVVTVVLHL